MFFFVFTLYLSFSADPPPSFKFVLKYLNLDPLQPDEDIKTHVIQMNDLMKFTTWKRRMREFSSGRSFGIKCHKMGGGE